MNQNDVKMYFEKVLLSVIPPKAERTVLLLSSAHAHLTSAVSGLKIDEVKLIKNLRIIVVDVVSVDRLSGDQKIVLKPDEKLRGWDLKQDQHGRFVGKARLGEGEPFDVYLNWPVIVSLVNSKRILIVSY